MNKLILSFVLFSGLSGLTTPTQAASPSCPYAAAGRITSDSGSLTPHNQARKAPDGERARNSDRQPTQTP